MDQNLADAAQDWAADLSTFACAIMSSGWEKSLCVISAEEINGHRSIRRGSGPLEK